MNKVYTKASEFGASLVEYALLVALIAAVCTAARILGSRVTLQFATTAAQMEASSGESGGGGEGEG